MSEQLDAPVGSHALCGACEGVTPVTPVRIDNRPGLTAISYRVGTHARFFESLIAGLSQTERLSTDASWIDLRAPLRDLRTRASEDFTIALLDSFAMMADVLTFYQERIANEQYIRTASELLSVRELARLIGYKLSAGVAAEAWLAFTLDDAAGAPGAVTLTPGIKVQSVPGPGELPQTFETVERVNAHAEWNALVAQQSRTSIPQSEDSSVFLEGVSTNLRVGDWLLFVGTEREKNPSSERWDFRQLQSVSPDLARNVTFVTWSADKKLGKKKGSRFVKPAAAAGMRVYAFRSRATLFGAAAPDPRLLTKEIRDRYVVPNDGADTWPKFTLRDIEPPTSRKRIIHLDGSTTHVTEKSWIVLVRPDAVDEYVELFQPQAVAPASLSRFGLAGKTTRVTLDDAVAHLGSHAFAAIDVFNKYIRQTVVHTQSEELRIAQAPIVDAVPEIATDPIAANEVTLDRIIAEPGAGRIIVFRGPRAHLRVDGTKTRLAVLDDNGKARQFHFVTGDVLELLEPPITANSWAALRASSVPGTMTPNVDVPSKHVLYHLRSTAGDEGWVVALRDPSQPPVLSYVPAPPEAAVVSEVVAIKEVSTIGTSYTHLTLETPLTMSYDRAALRILANVVRSTHGEAVLEALGGGTGAPFEAFTLKQAPLTFVRSATAETGASSTLRVTVNDLVWTEVDNFYGRGKRDRIFITRQDDGGKTAIEFGDGVTGARLPTGSENVRATYRKGIGLGGEVRADRLSSLLARPLGVRSVTNPLAAANAADAEQLRDAATNAPSTVLTLGRIVSLRDYEDFARTYVGVAKALANWTFDHNARGVYITIAGVNGRAVADNSELQQTLIEKLSGAGNARVPVQVHGYRPAYFRLAAQIKVDEVGGFQDGPVLLAVRAALTNQFAFAARAFGQSVPLSEVIAVMQNVRGVLAVDILQLYRADHPGGVHSAPPLLKAHTPGDGNNAEAVQPAELLMLDPDSTPTLEPMG